jgi:hypothetical protein
MKKIIIKQHNNSIFGGSGGIWPYSSSSLRASSQPGLNITTEYSWISGHHYSGGGMNDSKRVSSYNTQPNFE